jgi:hypothetical protein
MKDSFRRFAEQNFQPSRLTQMSQPSAKTINGEGNLAKVSEAKKAPRA